MTVSSSRAQQSPRAFTLVELLVVLGLVSGLALLLLPAMARTRDTTRTHHCLSHLRQWGIATGLYELDSGGWLPADGAPNGISPRNAWYVELPQAIGLPAYPDEGPWRTNALAPLGQRIWFCPSNPRRSNGHLLFHFALNRFVNGSGKGSRRMRLDAIPAPARTIWLFDNARRAAVAGPGNLHGTLHRGAANVLFLDGGVRRVASASGRSDTTPDGLSDDPLWIP
ncbi:MAG: hypothetical protein RLZZ34_1324 [Verrucomicrobiota bacterium]|jgi:general secretion pathway protein G